MKHQATDAPPHVRLRPENERPDHQVVMRMSVQEAERAADPRQASHDYLPRWRGRG
jgi:hypothetical protein